MNEFNDDNKVVQANELVTCNSFAFNEVSLKIFKILVSCLDTSDENNNLKVTISKNELYKFFDYEKNGNYIYLRNQMRELQRKGITIAESDGSSTDSILIPNVTWKKNSDLIECTFNSHLSKFLINLKKNFIQYDVRILKYFNSKYTIIIYEYIKALSKGRSGKITLDMVDLRKVTCTKDKFKNFNDFKRKVLDVAQKEINESSDISISYKPIKSGKKVVKIEVNVAQSERKKKTNAKYNNVFSMPDYNKPNEIEISDEVMEKYFPKKEQ